MTLPIPTGTLDPQTNQIVPNNTGTWDDLSGLSWAEWNTWVTKPANPLVWLTDVLDLGQILDFNLKITTEANGIVSYVIYVSDTGEFGGEETVTTVNSGDTNVPGFSGQFVCVAVNVAQTLGINTLDYVELKANDARVNILLKDVDTSGLTGTTSSRTLELPRNVSKIFDIIITPHELASAYNLDLYVSSTATSKQVVPRIVSKDSTEPKIALVGLDNQPRDAVVDISIWALPEQTMDGNNLTTR